MSYDIKENDVITLANGKRVKVKFEDVPQPVQTLVPGKQYSLFEDVPQPVQTLVPGKQYSLAYSSSFYCVFGVLTGRINISTAKEYLTNKKWQFIGQVNTIHDVRNIFYNDNLNLYAMFGSNTMNYAFE